MVTKWQAKLDRTRKTLRNMESPQQRAQEEYYGETDGDAIRAKLRAEIAELTELITYLADLG